MKRIGYAFALLFLLAFTSVQLSQELYGRAAGARLSFLSPETDSFRAQQRAGRSLALLTLLQEETRLKAGELLAILAASGDGAWRWCTEAAAQAAGSSGTAFVSQAAGGSGAAFVLQAAGSAGETRGLQTAGGSGAAFVSQAAGSSGETRGLQAAGSSGVARGAQEVLTAQRKRAGRTALKWRSVLLRHNRTCYERLCRAYGAVWDDVRCFPVLEGEVSFENSWMFERSYGGTYGHEGTDLMPPENISGYYPVVSMTDGVVEKLGWLPKGGWRVGIRSPSGGYFYYAHLSGYAAGLSVGDAVQAGSLLGTMGDTGYGPEGTEGKFDVHLHLGVYIRTEHLQEMSVNPYWLLRHISKGSVASSG